MKVWKENFSNSVVSLNGTLVYCLPHFPVLSFHRGNMLFAQSFCERCCMGARCFAVVVGKKQEVGDGT